MADESLPSFGSAEYWESEYSQNVKTEEIHDWLLEWDDVGWLLCSLLNHDRSKTILHLGNGNSVVPEELHKLGYTRQIATDISLSCTSHMQDRLMDTSVQFLQADACDLQPKDLFADATFDLVFEKSTLDALECNDDKHALLMLSLLKEAHRVLKPGGTFLSISMFPPKCLNVFLRLRCFGWRISCIPLRQISVEAGKCPSSNAEQSQQSLPYVDGDGVEAAMEQLKARYEELATTLCQAQQPGERKRQNYHYCYICTNKNDEAMQEHWKEIFETMSKAPDESPPKRFAEDCDEDRTVDLESAV